MQRSAPLSLLAAALLLAAAAHADDFKTTDKGCKVFDYDAGWPAGETHRTRYSWTGACVDGYASGPGELNAFLDGKPDETTTGSIQKGRLQGPATTNFPDGSQFKGSYEAGSRNGKGSLTLGNGSRFEGDFNQGAQTGKGTMTGPDGSVYDGDFVDGHETGKAVLTVTADDKTIDKKDRNQSEPVQFYTGRDHMLYELVVWSVDKNKITGYLTTPKNAPIPVTATQ